MGQKPLELFMINILNKKLITYIILALIAIIGVLLRFYQLGVNPPSLTWDEASLGYNAYSILKTGADEYGNKWPIAFRSFDDFKPPVYVYLTVPSVALFGLTEFAVRLPSALIGVLAIIITYFLTAELFAFRSDKNILSLLAAFFLAISPWHLQFSRTAFEGNIGLTFFLAGILFFLKATKSVRFLLLSSLSFILSMYSYHSFRLVIPVFLFCLALLFWRQFITKKIIVGSSIILFIILCIPVILSFVGQGSASVGSRLSMVSVFAPSEDLSRSIMRTEYDRTHGDVVGSMFHNRRVVYFLAVAKGYLDHFNLDFLFLHGDGGRQHHAVDMGMLYLLDLPFLVLGIVALSVIRRKSVVVLLLWLLLAPIASAISTGTPHPVRAIAMIPVLQIYVAFGVITLVVFLKKYATVKWFVGSAMIVLFLLNVVYYFHQYYVHTPIEYGDFWQYGHKETFAEVSKIEDEFDRIIVTYKYDQPYIYYLFYNKIDPAWYQKNWDYLGTGEVERMKRIIGKYEFRNINWETDQNLKNTLLIASPEEVPDNAKIFKKIGFPDGSSAFVFIKT